MIGSARNEINFLLCFKGCYTDDSSAQVSRVFVKKVVAWFVSPCCINYLSHMPVSFAWSTTRDAVPLDNDCCEKLHFHVSIGRIWTELYDAYMSDTSRDKTTTSLVLSVEWTVFGSKNGSQCLLHKIALTAAKNLEHVQMTKLHPKLF